MSMPKTRVKISGWVLGYLSVISGGFRFCCVGGGGRREFQGGAKFTNLVN